MALNGTRPSVAPTADDGPSRRVADVLASLLLLLLLAPLLLAGMVTVAGRETRPAESIATNVIISCVK
jgi:hypothetical protein